MRGFKHPFHVDTFKTLEAAREAYPHVDPDRFVSVELGTLYNHPTLGIVRHFTPDGENMSLRKASLTVDSIKKDGKIVTVAPDSLVLIHVHNDATKLMDTFELKFDVQGSTYTLLLSKQVTEGGEQRMKGLASVRELIDNIGGE